ncbi:hypothetical protein vBPaeSPAJD1_1 [Pseudomonas phage vB_PaeS_PAJD-1]|uniref:Uncharacterized protein n=1 Tax=Pseudomonas phage vB_PaeS_PAJD-1 TaxID=2822848 RepID=A0AAE7RA50_9CAUD|nr:hypothetical protein P6F32_gp01 [Pseudomonas phage vB_PaeS_PAJD-1]QTP92290.1 hypothetical protein vBPaeSPAJD1_1 [Pseudomonas phage vB_PaeS_PAJD-1]
MLRSTEARRHATGRRTAEATCRGGSLGAHIDLLVDVLDRADLVGVLVLTGGVLAELHLDLHGQAVQLAGVLNVQNADSMRDRRQLLVGDFLGHRIGVAQVQAHVDLAVGVLAVDDVETGLEVSTGAVLGRLHFRLVDHRVIPARGDGLETEIRGDLGCIKVQLCHGF